MNSIFNPTAGSQASPCLLALESSGERCSVALLHQGRTEILYGPAHGAQSESMLVLTDTLLARSGIDAVCLQGVAFSQGPGSFTGLRLACGIAQGLALALDIPLFPVSTLQAQALVCNRTSTQVISTLDARMGQLYLAAYVLRDQAWVCAIPPCLCNPETPPDLPADSGPWTLVGSAVEAYAGALSAAWRGHELQPLRSVSPDALQLLTLAESEWRLGRGCDSEAAYPLYVRDKVALTRRERLG